MQRLRICFARRGGARYLSHLELMRLWERALRRAGLRVAHSHGYNPHPKLSFAAALPVGVAGDAELLEVQLESSREPAQVAHDLAARLPEGVEVRSVEEVPPGAPVLQRILRAAEYVALCPRETDGGRLRNEAERLLSASSLPRERRTEERVRTYDLRPLIRRLEVVQDEVGRVQVKMQLKADTQGAGRPDEVLREMGLDPAGCDITRTRLLLAEEE